MAGVVPALMRRRAGTDQTQTDRDSNTPPNSKRPSGRASRRARQQTRGARRHPSQNRKGPSQTATARGPQGRGRGPGATLGGRQGQRAPRPASRPPAPQGGDGAGPPQPTTGATGPRTRHPAPRPNGPHNPPLSSYLHPPPHRGASLLPKGGCHHLKPAAGQATSKRHPVTARPHRKPTHKTTQSANQGRQTQRQRQTTAARHHPTGEVARDSQPPLSSMVTPPFTPFKKPPTRRRGPAGQGPPPPTAAWGQKGTSPSEKLPTNSVTTPFQTPSPSEIVSHPAR